MREPKPQPPEWTESQPSNPTITVAPTLGVFLTIGLLVVSFTTGPGIATGASMESKGSASTQASFDVSINATNSPIVAGQTLRVRVTVRNTGSSGGQQEIYLQVDDDVQDTRKVTLDAGEKKTFNLSWSTTSGDAGNYTITVGSQDDAAFRDVTVKSPPNFSVVITDTTSPVNEGERLRVLAKIVNEGNISSTQNVTFSVAGKQRDTENVTLAGGESKTVVLAWSTVEGDAGKHTATVKTPSDSDAVVVRVNARPAVAITYEPTGPSTGQQVTFVADASDPDGSIESYEWRIDGKLAATARTVNHTFSSPGSHVVSLQVTDDNGASNTTNVTVDVTEGNVAPVVSIGYAPEVPATGSRVRFSAEATDPDGAVRSYEWTVDGETVGSGPDLNHTFDSPGRHEVAVTATDDGGTSTSASVTVTVNARPQASIEYSPTEPVAGQEVEFVASASDPDGNVTSVEWRVDGEAAGSGPETRYTFETTGSHDVTLTVTDDRGASIAVSITVSVRTPSTPTPSPTRTPTDPDGTTVPGFTAGAGLLAVLATFLTRRLLAITRDRR